MHSTKSTEYCLISLGLGLAAVLGGCAGSDTSRAVCEGLQARVRIVDPLADPKTARDQITCHEYEVGRKRLQKQEER
jgi:hypothetical protein